MIFLLEILVVAVLALIAVTLVMDERSHMRRQKRIVKLKSYWDGVNRRSVVRHSVSLEVNYKVQDGVRLSRTRDISTHGIGLVLEEKYARRTIMDVEIKLDDRGPLRARARVMWSRESVEDEEPGHKRLFHTGLKFIKFQSPGHEKKLFDYIRTIEKDSVDEYARF